MDYRRSNRSKKLRWRLPSWLENIALSAGITLVPGSIETCVAQDLPPPVFASLDAKNDTINSEITVRGQSPSISLFDPGGDSFTPVSETPNFFGEFTGLATQVSAQTTTTQTLVYTGVGAEGGGQFILAPVVVNGPGGPFNLTNNLLYNRIGFDRVMIESPQLTTLLQGTFPGAVFDSGNGTLNAGQVAFNYNYLFNTTTLTTIALPNPSGGGSVGRVQYFDYGSAFARDRCFFVYDHVSDYDGFGRGIDINRYLFGLEKATRDGNASIELRLPFAGTLNSDQTVGQGLSTDQSVFGNIGFASKLVLLRNANWIVTTGLGLSIPTAPDSRLLAGNIPILTIDNQAILIQPLFAMTYAPNDTCYTQFAGQLDFDPSGNPILVPAGGGTQTHLATLHDQTRMFLNSSIGCWLTRTATTDGMRGLAAQCDLHYNSSLGSADIIQAGTTSLSDLERDYHSLSIIPGVFYRLSNQANAGIGVALPLDGNVAYDWSLSIQFNRQYGPSR